MEIITLTSDHWYRVKEIYEQGIATGNATFQSAAPAWQEWDELHVKAARIVAVEDEKIIGWAALTPVSGRCVYAGVAEVSVYVATEVQGKGVGLALLNELVKRSEEAGFWTLTAGVFPENIGSLRIHEKTGFKVLGIRERIGKMNGRWRDTVLLERRSGVVGIDDIVKREA